MSVVFHQSLYLHDFFEYVMTDTERVALAQSLGRAQLIEHWQRLQAGELMPDWGGRGYALEYLILRAFELELEDEAVCWPYNVTSEQLRLGTLEQIDGVLYTPQKTFLVEAKCEGQAVNVEPLAKLRFRLENRPPATMGILVSMEGFTEVARLYASFATPLNVLLWTKEDIEATLPVGRMLDGLKRKLRFAVERKSALLDLETNYQERP